MPNEFRIYRPNKNNNGWAAKFQLKIDKKDGYENSCVMLQCSQQIGVDNNGNAQFAWTGESKSDNTKNVTMKLGPPDIGAILAVFSGRKNTIGEKGLYHQNQHGNTVLKFDANENNYSLQISAKRENSLCRCSITLSFGEGEILAQLLKDSISRLYKWL